MVSVVGMGWICSAILEGDLIEALMCADEGRMLSEVLCAVPRLLIMRNIHEPKLVVHLEDVWLGCLDRVRATTIKRLEPETGYYARRGRLT